MRVVLLCTFLLTTLGTRAQVITAADLLTLWDYTLDSGFEKFVTDKGYTHQSALTKKHEGNRERYYEPGADKCTENIIQNVKSSVVYSTMRHDRYTQLKGEFAALGFVDFTEVNDGTSTSKSNLYPDYMLMLYEDKALDTCNTKRTRYGFYVYKQRYLSAEEFVKLADCKDYNNFVWALGKNGYKSDLSMLASRSVMSGDSRSSSYEGPEFTKSKQNTRDDFDGQVELIEPFDAPQGCTPGRVEYKATGITYTMPDAGRYNQYIEGFKKMGFIISSAPSITDDYTLESPAYRGKVIRATTTIKSGLCNLYTITITGK